MRLLRRLLAMVRRNRLDDQLAEEIELHLELRQRALIAAGRDPRDAEIEARRMFGNVAGLREDARDMRSFPSLDSFLQDLRFGARLLARRPGFTAAVVLTLALATGLNGALFLIFNASTLKPPALKDVERVVRLDDGRPSLGPTYPDYVDYRDRSTTFAALAASGTTDAVLSAASRGISNDRVRAVLASGNYFDVAQVAAVAGRTFGPAEDRPHAAQAVAMLGDAYWARAFNRDPSIVGSTITLNFVPFVVIGVLPPDFTGLTTTFRVPELWVPLWSLPTLVPGNNVLDGRTFWWGMEVVGRLKSGVQLADARGQIAAIAASLDREYLSQRRERTPGLISVTSLDTRLFRIQPGREAEDALGALVAAAAALFILLIACANVASLLLARASAREREIGVRISLGAGRGRLIRQFLTESLTLSAFGTALGIVVAQWTLGIAFRDPARQPLVWSFAFDRRVLVFAVALAGVTALASGFIPAMLASRNRLVPGLKSSGSRTSMGRMRAVFVGAEVALCVILVAATALFLRAALRAATLDPILPVEELLILETDSELHGYSGDRRAALLGEIDRRVAALPGVVATAFVDNPPFGHDRSGTSLRRADDPDGPGTDVLNARVSPAFFATAGIPLVRGRAPRAAPVPEIVVNETLARRLWSSDDPVGQRVWSGTFDRKQYVVVGIVRDVPYTSLQERTGAFFFATLEPRQGGRMIVRTRGPAASLVRVAKARVEEIDPTLQVSAIPVTAGVIDEVESAFNRVQAAGMVGALALLLAAIGIAAVTSQVVVDRTHEIGVRIALGARAGDAVRLLLLKGLRPVAGGLLAGTGGALLLGRGLSAQLYGLSPADPIAFAGAAAVLIAVAAFAAYVPARRASSVDPIIALRAE